MKVTRFLVVAALLVLSVPALVRDASAKLNGCTVSTSGITFGNYDVLASGDIAVTGTFTIANCGGSGTATLIADAGQNSSGSFNPRKMKLTTGSDTLNYNLYTDSAHSTIWNTTTGFSFTGNESNVNYYGLLPAGQTGAGIGMYQDTVTITINN